MILDLGEKISVEQEGLRQQLTRLQYNILFLGLILRSHRIYFGFSICVSQYCSLDGRVQKEIHLGHRTYCAVSGRDLFKASKVLVKAMPVARGSTVVFEMSSSPVSKHFPCHNIIAWLVAQVWGIACRRSLYQAASIVEGSKSNA